MPSLPPTTDSYEVRVKKCHRELGIPEDYLHRGLTLQQEARPHELVTLPLGRFSELVTVTSYTAEKWGQLTTAAKNDGIELCISCGFRSLEEQHQILKRYLSAGDSVDALLRQFTAPGYSEHHTGRALDIGIDDCEGLPYAENYERSNSFKWLTRNGESFGFSLSYPRENPYGLIYEPWHWLLKEPTEETFDLAAISINK